ncbi:MAG: hypothetical protein LBK67_10035 [Coriobacteriales bacterium]|nr:hypothetical protein [Coriobacteriales bacterium]
MTAPLKSHPPISDDQVMRQLAGEVCPHCARHMITPGSRGANLGICDVCFRKAKNDALADVVALEETRRERDRLKKQLQRARGRKGGGGRGS